MVVLRQAGFRALGTTSLSVSMMTDSRLSTAVERGSIAGAVALVADVENDVRWSQVAGLADVSGEVPMSTDTLFWAASALSNSFASYRATAFPPPQKIWGASGAVEGVKASRSQRAGGAPQWVGPYKGLPCAASP